MALSLPFRAMLPPRPRHDALEMSDDPRHKNNRRSGHGDHEQERRGQRDRKNAEIQRLENQGERHRCSLSRRSRGWRFWGEYARAHCPDTRVPRPCWRHFDVLRMRGGDAVPQGVTQALRIVDPDVEVGWGLPQMSDRMRSGHGEDIQKLAMKAVK